MNNREIALILLNKTLNPVILPADADKLVAAAIVLLEREV